MRFSFLYDEERYSSDTLPHEDSRITDERGIPTLLETYRVGCLTVTRELKQYPGGAEYSLLRFENTGSDNSAILRDVCDLDEDYAFDAPSLPLGFYGRQNPDYLRLERMIGSNHAMDEFQMESVLLMDEIPPEFSSRGGRSSHGYAPFFELKLREQGRLFALGWTGQWKVRVKKTGPLTNVRAGVEGLRFQLYPGEKIRTCSVLTLPYSDGSVNAKNRIKRLIKAHFSPRNIEGELPFFTSFFGGSSTPFILRQLDTMQKSGLPFECLWLDSGWYGDHRTLCKSEFDGSGGDQTGNWFVNEFVHPGGLRDVAAKIRGNGMKFMLWFEAEKSSFHSRVYAEHPDWFLHVKGGETPQSALLNLSLPEAQDYLFELISGYVTELGLDFYRQDFNMSPLAYWEAADPPERRGMTQILYVMGMYRVWDRLLERHPNLIIDNCASGGRRIDLETLSRAIPFWRSDYQCSFDTDGEAGQCHTTGISAWIPYSGTGMGLDVYDKYKFRSAYSAAMCSNFFGYQCYAEPDLRADVLGPLLEEYRSVRKYYSCDFYPIFGHPLGRESWSGYQFDRPEEGDGIVMAFRRPACPSAEATVFPKAEFGACYLFTDADSGESFRLTGEELSRGLTLRLPCAGDSKLLRYRKV